MTDLEEIENILFNKEYDSTINKNKIYDWMNSNDMEVRCALTSLLNNNHYSRKIKPSIDFEEYYIFMFEFYSDCMRKNFDGKWCDSPYISAHDLNSFIMTNWFSENLPNNKIKKFRNYIVKRLEYLCKNADDSLKDVLVNGLLEHLLENKKIRTHFISWKENKVLMDFYECAIDKKKSLFS